MEWYRLLFTITLAFSFSNTQLAAVQQQPALPSSFYGTVLIDGENVPTGTTIQAVIKGQAVATCQSLIYEGVSVYTMDIPGDDPGTNQVKGGTPGDTIIFYVNGLQAAETGIWRSGTNVEHNLTVLSTSTQAPITPTKTPTRTPIKPSATIANAGDFLQTPAREATQTTSAQITSTASVSAEVNANPTAAVAKVEIYSTAYGEAYTETSPADTQHPFGAYEKSSEVSREGLMRTGTNPWPWMMAGGLLMSTLFGIYWVGFRKQNHE